MNEIEVVEHDPEDPPVDFLVKFWETLPYAFYSMDKLLQMRNLPLDDETSKTLRDL